MTLNLTREGLSRRSYMFIAVAIDITKLSSGGTSSANKVIHVRVTITNTEK
jgi:hypothetical protein